MTQQAAEVAPSPVRGLFTAVQFLTRIPISVGSPQSELGEALVWMPVVGLLLGAVLAGLDAVLRWFQLGPLLDSAILVVALLVLTGGLHADGLMDTCDAVFGHASPERRLEIMRDPRVGSFGVMGLAAIVLLKFAALDALAEPWRLGFLVLAPTLGRWAIVLLATLFPYGRASGLGSPLKAAASPRGLLVASAVPAIGCLVLGPVGVVSGLVAAVVAYGSGRWLLTLLPGLTGDCYGATCETVETVVWLGAAMLLPHLAGS